MFAHLKSCNSILFSSKKWWHFEIFSDFWLEGKARGTKKYQRSNTVCLIKIAYTRSLHIWLRRIIAYAVIIGHSIFSDVFVTVRHSDHDDEQLLLKYIV